MPAWEYLVSIYILGIVFIGVPMGMKSITVWEKYSKSDSAMEGFWGQFLFPITAWSKGHVKRILSHPMLIEDYFRIYEDRDWRKWRYDFSSSAKQEYVGLTSILWPLRIFFNGYINLCFVAFGIGSIVGARISRTIGQLFGVK